MSSLVGGIVSDGCAQKESATRPSTPSRVVAPCPSMSALTVMVVDGQPVFGEALALAIDAAPKLSCVAVAPDADEAERLAAETQPDVVVMDLGPDGTDVIAATRSLRESHPGTRVLVLTGQSPDAPLVRAAAEAGASALLTKASRLSVVVDAISSLTEDCFTLDRTTVRELCEPSLGQLLLPRRPVSRVAHAPRAGHSPSPGAGRGSPDRIAPTGHHGEHRARLRQEPLPKAGRPQPVGAAGRGSGDGPARTGGVTPSGPASHGGHR